MSDKKKIQKIVVGGILINNNKVLILQRNINENIFPNIWELPSGKKEFEETTEQALVREFYEEAGIKIKIINIISVFDYVIKKKDEIRYSTQINFLVKFKNKKNTIKISEEHQNFMWVNKKSLNNFNLTKLTKNVLKKVFDNLVI